MKKGWSGGKIAAVIIGAFAAVIILVIAFVASVFHLSDVLVTFSDEVYEEAFLSWDFDDDDDVLESPIEEESENENDDRKSAAKKKRAEREKNREEEEAVKEPEDEEEYYEFGDAITEGLSYNITFEEYERDDFINGGDGYIYMECHYPVVSGEVPNLDGINEAISAEKEKIEEHAIYVADYLGGSAYEYEATAYVTYMSEELLSVAYVEYVYLDGDFLESFVIPVNIDMETGMVLKNNQMLDVDDDFSVEFRKRCEKQNGEIDGISYMSDQEITDYLTDEETLIVFYTPLGMEIGFNYPDGWVTVTYSNFQKYQQQF